MTRNTDFIELKDEVSTLYSPQTAEAILPAIEECIAKVFPVALKLVEKEAKPIADPQEEAFRRSIVFMTECAAVSQQEDVVKVFTDMKQMLSTRFEPKDPAKMHLVDTARDYILTRASNRPAA